MAHARHVCFGFVCGLDMYIASDVRRRVKKRFSGRGYSLAVARINLKIDWRTHPVDPSGVSSEAAERPKQSLCYANRAA